MSVAGSGTIMVEGWQGQEIPRSRGSLGMSVAGSGTIMVEG
ncbi:MAG: hypothetical protein R3B35_05930 [Gemmatimonadales bacterium]